MSFDTNSAYDAFMKDYLKNSSFELNSLSDGYSAYQFSFYEGNIVKLYKEEFSGAKSVLTGKYDANSYQIKIEWDKVYYLDDKNVVSKYGDKKCLYPIETKDQSRHTRCQFHFCRQRWVTIINASVQKDNIERIL